MPIFDIILQYPTTSYNVLQYLAISYNIFQYLTITAKVDWYDNNASVMQNRAIPKLFPYFFIILFYMSDF